MERKQTRKKVVRTRPEPMLIARKDLQFMAEVLQNLAMAETLGPNIFEFIDHDVDVVLSFDRYNNATPHLVPTNLAVERGRKGGGPVSQKPGQKIRYHNKTGQPVTLTFWNNAKKDDSSIACKELKPCTLTLAKDAMDIVRLTDNREGRGHQDIWVGIEFKQMAPGSGIGGGPDMGIDDP